MSPTICLLSSEHPPLDKRVFQKEGRSLASAGFRVVHLCPDDGQGSRIEDGVEIVTYPRRRGKLRRLAGLVDLGRRARRVGADAFHCNEPDSWVVGVVLKLISGKVVVFDCHEHYPGQVVRWLPAGTRALGAHATKYVLQLLGLATDLIVLAKYSVADDFSWSRRKQLVVLNTTPIAALPTALPEVDRDRDGTFRFVHIGVIRRERGSEQLLEAIGRLADRGRRDFRVIIVGEFKDGSEGAFFARADEMGVRDLIEFHRWMPFDEAFELVRRSHAGFILFQKGLENNVRAMPHKMFDYMLAGIPVIGPDFATDVVGVIRDTNAGVLLDTSDAEALASAMERFIDDRAYGEALGQNGRRAVLERYNWEADAAKLVSAYRSILAVKGVDDGAVR